MLLTRIGHGDLTAVARANVFIVLRPLPGMPEIDKELGVHLWHALGSERGIQKVVSTLAQSGLENMPEFALVQPRSNALHVIVRGSFNVLLLNHDGRYSSVGSDEMATWREYTSLSASEWCVRATPGTTVESSEAFYLASGVSRISVMASLGWDDPESPETVAEKKETVGIPAHEIAPQSAPTRHVVPEAVATPIPSAPVLREPIVPEPVVSESVVSAPSVPEPAVTVTGVETIVMPVILEDAIVTEDTDESATALNDESVPNLLNAVDPETKVPLETPLAPNSLHAAQTVVFDAIEQDFEANALSGAHQLPETQSEEPQTPPKRVSSAQILQPLSGQNLSIDEPDIANTMLTNNLVEIRAHMAADEDFEAPAEAVTAIIGIPMPALKLSNGVRIPLDRTVLIGRAPEASRVSLRELPRLVNVASPNNDISRTHAQVRVEGEFVLVTDLNSTNGVFMISQGQAPQRLHPDEPTQLLPGTVVDLGDGATFELEVPQ